jgi:hypothetical protein
MLWRELQPLKVSKRLEKAILLLLRDLQSRWGDSYILEDVEEDETNIEFF